MLGAIIGDVAGSGYEWHPLKVNWDEFPLFSGYSRFTDDSVMTLAVADGLRQGYGREDLQEKLIDALQSYGNDWPKAGYGKRFSQWLREKDREPYNSFGNGSAMRVSPVGWVAKSLEEAEQLAQISAQVSHNHPEGIKGAQAVAGAIWLARKGGSRNEIRNYVQDRYHYDLNRTLEEIRRTYHFDVTCQGSVPEAIIAFLESDNFEGAVRKAIWLRGDADTQAAIAGSIAEAFYGGVPDDIAEWALGRLPKNLYEKYVDLSDFIYNQANAV